MKAETRLQNKIRVALSEVGCIVHRCNSGLYYSEDGRPVRCGEVGHSDLYGHKSNGLAFYIEVKLPGEDVVPGGEQEKFINAMRKTGALAGVAHSIEEALKIVG